MKQGIIIVTSEPTKAFLSDCIKSCQQDKYPILVVSNNGYMPYVPISGIQIVVNDWNGFELGGIVRGMEYFDEFILLQDTTIVKDQSIFDIAFSFPGSVYFTEDLAYHYCAKFRTEVLKKMTIPRVHTVREATDNERSFGLQYLQLEPEDNRIYISPGVPCGQAGDPIVERHGRKGIVVSNQYFEKHKTNY